MVKGEPAMVEVVRALFEHFLPEVRMEGCSLKNLRSAATSRFEEVTNLRISDLSVSEDGNLGLVFREAKNIQLGNARLAMVASMGSKWCPVRVLVNYLGRMKGHPWSPEDFLLRAGGA